MDKIKLTGEQVTALRKLLGKHQKELTRAKKAGCPKTQCPLAMFKTDDGTVFVAEDRSDILFEHSSCNALLPDKTKDTEIDIPLPDDVLQELADELFPLPPAEPGPLTNPPIPKGLKVEDVVAKDKAAAKSAHGFHGFTEAGRGGEEEVDLDS